MDKDIEIYFGKMETIVRTFSAALKEFDSNVLTSVNTMKATSNAMGENEEWTGSLYEDFNKSLADKLNKLVSITNDFEALSEKLDQKADQISENIKNFM